MSFCVLRASRFSLLRSRASLLVHGGRALHLSAQLQQDAAPTAAADPKVAPTAAPHIQEIVEKISKLNLMEVRDFVKLLKFKLDIPDGLAMPMGMPMAAGAGAGGAPGAAAEAEAAEEQTAFTVKLKGFDAKSKVKVIKEVRALAKLGLKEAKALVESAPADVLKDLKKEEAEKIVEKIKAVGGDVEIV